MTPLLVAYGVGLDSTAMLIEMWRRGIRPDAILFADTGGEKPRTYEYLLTIQPWLESVGFPSVQVVRYGSPRAGDLSLEGECTRKSVLPGLAYGGHQCSLKWKAAPQDAWIKRWGPAIEAWKVGHTVRKAIGYDAGCRDKQRAGRAVNYKDPRFSMWFPLIEWDIAREACAEIIVSAGLPVPVKSACFFCPAMKRIEVDELMAESPELFQRALLMERLAHIRGLTKIKGLGRSWSWYERSILGR